eukprot:2704311-Lingulodinium_polyedra.AAC.1
MNEFELPVNFAPGKTEVIIKHRGKNAKHFRIKLLVEDDAKLRCNASNGLIEVRVVRSYKHLGGFASAALDMKPEIAHRKRTMWTAASKHRNNFYKSNDFETVTKVQTLDPYLLSRLLYNASTWPELNKTEFRSLHGAFLN